MEINCGDGSGNAKVIAEVDCPICMEKCNSATRKPIVCGQCEALACKKCVETYILGLFGDVDCMHCKKVWDADFLREVMTKTFCDTKLKKHREDILYEREKALLPATQVYIEIEKEKNAIYRKISALIREKEKLDDQISYHYAEIRVLDVSEKKDETTKQKFVRKCPAGDCRGFLSSSYKCGTCDVWVCPDCKEAKGFRKDVEHTCDPDVLASVKAIEADSKACPNCATLIFKIEGCHQMFCTSCNTVFDWKTLAINVGGPVHNPHYFEWVKKNGGNIRQVGDVPCGGLPYLTLFSRNILSLDNSDTMLRMYRIVSEVSDVWLRKYPVTSPVSGNRDLRIEYLKKKIDENEFKRQLQIREKKYTKNLAVRQVLDTFLTVAVENINAVNDIKKNNKTMKSAQVEALRYIALLDAIRDYTNECMLKISKKFGGKVPIIMKTWERVVKSDELI